MVATTCLDAALKYRDAGLSTLPVKMDGSKAPMGSWQVYQKRLPTEEEIRRGHSKPAGLGLIGGAVSGNLEILDFDEQGLYEQYEALADDHELGDLVRRCVQVQTPSGGNHLYYRSQEPVAGNQKLARTAGKKPKTRIETRGEGGYAVIPPSPASCHPEHRPYLFLRGDLTALPVFTAEEVQTLHRLAGVFDECPERIVDGESKRGPTNGDILPGTAFNEHGDPLPILQRGGWRVLRQSGETIHLQRPGKQGPGTSATWNYAGSRLLYVFSSNGDPFESCRAYRPFAICALMEHGGDYHAAARVLYRDGHGDRIQPEARKAVVQKPGERSAIDAIKGVLTTTLAGKADVGNMGVVFSKELTTPEMEEAGRQIMGIGTQVGAFLNFVKGDWYCALPDEYGAKADRVRAWFGEGMLQQIKNYGRVARGWSIARRDPGVPWSFYQETAGWCVKAQDATLTRWKEGGLTRKDLRQRNQERASEQDNHEVTEEPTDPEPTDLERLAELLAPEQIRRLVQEIEQAGADTVLLRVVPMGPQEANIVTPALPFEGSSPLQNTSSLLLSTLGVTVPCDQESPSLYRRDRFLPRSADEMFDPDEEDLVEIAA